MLPDNRKFQRFDINTVLEFKGADGYGESFIGIARNFSCEGFSLETQCLAFKPGNNLEVTLKHPRKDLTISLKGKVVWKRNDGKFACVLGIEFIDMDLDIRLSMLEILSITGNIPIDSFVIEKEVEDETEQEGTTGYDNEYNEAQKNSPVTEIPMEDDEYAGQSGIESTLVSSQDPGEPLYENFNSGVYTEQPGADDILSEERKDDLSEKEIEQTYDESSTFQGNFLVHKKKLIYASVTAVVAITLIYNLFGGSSDVAKNTPPVSTKSASSQKNNNILQPILPAGDAQPSGVIGRVVPRLVPPVSGQVKKGKDVEDKNVKTRQPQTDIQAVDNKSYFIQVGAWKNSNYASRMMVKVKKYYPDAYMIAESGFIKIKVPGIKNKTQGNRILKDIKDKFGVTPLLVLNK
jgi:hypothetical protein